MSTNSKPYILLLFSERELINVDISSRSLSPVRLSVVCRLSVTFVHPTQAIEIFGNVSKRLILGHQVKFYKDRPRETPSSGELYTRGVAEYRDFRPIERYISETVQDRS